MTLFVGGKINTHTCRFDLFSVYLTILNLKLLMFSISQMGTIETQLALFIKRYLNIATIDLAIKYDNLMTFLCQNSID